MNKDKKLPVRVQHYISQGILRLFSENKQSVFEFNLENNKVYRAGISTTMSDKLTYEHPFLPGNTLENTFKKIEDKYIPRIKSIVDLLENGKIDVARKEIETLLEYILLFYYRSGAILYEFSDNNEFDKPSVIENMLKRISDARYLTRLANTIISDYTFVVLKSENGEFLLSDQYVSTASLNCKGMITNFSNRTIGFADCLILIPLSSKYYVAYYNGSFPLSKPINSDKIYELTKLDLLNLNKVIIRNSYRKCIAMHRDELESVKEYKSSICGTVGTIIKYSNGSYRSYTIKKEVFYRDIDQDIFDHLLEYYSSLAKFKEVNHRKIGRNDLCLCGSNIKFKKCCIEKYKQAEHIYDMIKTGNTDWMHTKSNFVEMPIYEFWDLDTDLPKKQLELIKDLREATQDTDLKI